MQRNEKTKALRAQISQLVEEYAAIVLAPNPFDGTYPLGQ